MRSARSPNPDTTTIGNPGGRSPTHSVNRAWISRRAANTGAMLEPWVMKTPRSSRCGTQLLHYQSDRALGWVVDQRRRIYHDVMGLQCGQDSLSIHLTGN